MEGKSIFEGFLRRMADFLPVASLGRAPEDGLGYTMLRCKALHWGKVHLRHLWFCRTLFRRLIPQLNEPLRLNWIFLQLWNLSTWKGSGSVDSSRYFQINVYAEPTVSFSKSIKNNLVSVAERSKDKTLKQIANSSDSNICIAGYSSDVWVWNLVIPR